ncbi:hypothetical protein TNCV_1476271 [Trichonephila clavipes]|nr:hypothetical protein TNCV_1476271 [Trichonephila clavipes]
MKIAIVVTVKENDEPDEGKGPYKSRDQECHSGIKEACPYENFRFLPGRLQGVPFIVDQNLRLKHDDTPEHFSIAVYNHLPLTFLRKFTGHGGPDTQPPRSPDLNLLDFFF